MPARAVKRENGYIIIPRLVSQEKIDRYARRFKELCETPSLRPLTMTVMRDVALAKAGVSQNSEATITKLQDWQDDAVLSEYTHDAAILDYVEAWTGPRIVATHTMLINKPTDPGKGSSRHPLHQDMLYFPWGDTNKTVCSWTAMEKITRDNGCLIAVPGSHKTEILGHGYPDWDGGANKSYVGILGVTPDVKYVHLPMEAGDTIFFHPLLFHGSGRNQTPRFRKAISCHFASGDSRFINVAGTIQEDIELETIDIALTLAKRDPHSNIKQLHRTMTRSDFHHHVWATKSRAVRGGQMILPCVKP